MDPEDDVIAHRALWQQYLLQPRMFVDELADVTPEVMEKLFLASPANMIRVAQSFRHPAFVFPDGSARDPAAATDRPILHLRRAASSEVAVEHGTPVALAETLAPYQSALSRVLNDYQKDLEKELRSSSASGRRMSELVNKDFPPLAVTPQLEPEESHNGKIP